MMLVLPSSAAPPLYKVAGAPIDERVADLVARMTLEEKVNQLALPFGAHYPEDYVKYNGTGLGATYPLAAQPNESSIQTRNDWQRWQLNNSRLGIPTSFIGETLHSGAGHGTVYPMPCLQGATWDTELVGEVAAAIASEASATGVDRGFSPVLHFCTDPRFGRCEEAFSEDPMLVSKLGAAAVTGLSGPGAAGAANTYLAAGKIATEAKHFAAYGHGGRDGSMPAELSEATLFDVYLKPWYHYAQSGGRAIMAAHNEATSQPGPGPGPGAAAAAAAAAAWERLPAARRWAACRATPTRGWSARCARPSVSAAASARLTRETSTLSSTSASRRTRRTRARWRCGRGWTRSRPADSLPMVGMASS